MKKILVVTMVLALAIASVGCGSEKKEDNTTAASEAAKADGEAGNTSEAANYFKGSSAGKTYTNDVYGITFTSPEGQWIYAEPSELASRVGKTSDEVNSMTFEDVKGGKVFPAMMCTNMSSGESVSFILSASMPYCSAPKILLNIASLSGLVAVSISLNLPWAMRTVWEN